jgi:hypothetical protein
MRDKDRPHSAFFLFLGRKKRNAGKQWRNRGFFVNFAAAKREISIAENEKVR